MAREWLGWLKRGQKPGRNPRLPVNRGCRSRRERLGVVLDPEQRHAADVALRIMREAAYLYRRQALLMQGVSGLN